MSITVQPYFDHDGVNEVVGEPLHATLYEPGESAGRAPETVRVELSMTRETMLAFGHRLIGVALASGEEPSDVTVYAYVITARANE